MKKYVIVNVEILKQNNIPKIPKPYSQNKAIHDAVTRKEKKIQVL
jgi:hypothetical protein